MFKLLKKYLKAILTGDTRTHLATFEQREMFADVNVAKKIHENINKEKSFEIIYKGKKFIINDIN